MEHVGLKMKKTFYNLKKKIGQTKTRSVRIFSWYNQDAFINE